MRKERLHLSEGIQIIKKNVLAKKKSIRPSKPKEKSMEVAKENYNDTKVKVSVAIPCYNHGEFVKEAIQSVLESTFDHYEIIIVDDGSTDAFTLKVLRELEQKFANDQRIKIIHQDNLGTSDARNNAIKMAKGEYILPLDADNKIRPHYLSKAVEILDKNPEVGVVYTYANFLGEKEGIWEFPEFDEQRLLVGNFIDACSLFRKRVWEECNGYDPDMRIGYEDWELWISAMEKGWKFHLIKETLFDYRVLSNSRVSFCNIPENRRVLIKYICNKHKNTYIENLAYVISEKDAAILNANNQASNLEAIIKEQDTHIGNLDAQIQAKDTHIYNIESELKLIKQSKVWRIAEVFRRLFYIKLLGKFTLLQKGMLTLRREGVLKFITKTIRYFESDYDRWIKKNRLTNERIAEIKDEITRFEYNPKISIIMPVYNVDQIWLEKAIDSVISQLYVNWELCIADDASTKNHVKKTLKRYSRKDRRIKAKYLDENQGISGASNEALSLATGDFIGLLDNDDELSVYALYECVKLLNMHPEADMIYTDEDKLDTKGRRCEPFFKPDWSPDTFFSGMYTCHFGVYRKNIVDEIGGFRKGYEGSQDYDLVLRFTERTNNIFHIPKILYHWRKIEGSAAVSAEAKDYAYVNAKLALNDALTRKNIPGKIEYGQGAGYYTVVRKILDNPLVSIIIPTSGRLDTLERCLESIIGKTKWDNYEIIIVTEDVDKVIDSFGKQNHCRVISYENTFSLSAMLNFGVRESNGDHLLFLHDDVEVISDDWLSRMLEHSQRNEVGVVGAKLLRPDHTVEHAGIILGIKGVAGHAYHGLNESNAYYFNHLNIIKNYSAVSSVCMMIKKSLFEEIGGFNEENLPNAFNDVDLCLRLRRKGFLNVYTPFSLLYHYNSNLSKCDLTEDELDYMQNEWGDILISDPYYNINLTLDKEDFSLRV